MAMDEWSRFLLSFGLCHSDLGRLSDAEFAELWATYGRTVRIMCRLRREVLPPVLS